MLIWSRTEAGSIREINQDYLSAREDQGIMVLANGCGASGREAAEEAAESLVEKLWKIRLQANVEASGERLERALNEIGERIIDMRLHRPGFQNSGVSLSATCVVEGKLFLCNAGIGGILASVNGTSVKLDEPSARVVGPLSFSVGDWVLAFSEGLLISQPLPELEAVTHHLHEDYEAVIPTTGCIPPKSHGWRMCSGVADGIFQAASRRYDGDDRTLALSRFLPSDFKRINADDEVVETHIDKTFTIPVWGGLLAAFVIGFFYRVFEPVVTLFFGDEL